MSQPLFHARLFSHSITSRWIIFLSLQMCKERFLKFSFKGFCTAGLGGYIGVALSMKLSANLFCCIYDRLKVLSVFLKLKAANVMNVRWTLWTSITNWWQSLMKFESWGTASKNMKILIGFFKTRTRGRKWMHAFIGKALFPIVMQALAQES